MEPAERDYRPVPATAVLVRAAQPASGPAAGQLLFDPLGRDIALFAPAPPLAPDERVTGADQIACPLTIRRLDALLDAGLAPPFAIRVNGALMSPVEMLACDLGQWRTTLPGAGMRAGIDPARGRIVLLGAPADATVTVDYWQPAAVRVDGSAAVLGAGAWLRDDPAGENHATPPSTPIQLTANTTRDIRLTDNAVQAGPLALDLAAGSSLTLRAATGVRWTLAGPLVVSLAAGAELRLVGLLAGAAITVTGEGSLTIEESTLLRPLTWTAGMGGTVTIERSAISTLAIGPLVDLTACDTIVDGDVGTSPDGAGIINLDRVTVTGRVRGRMCGCISNSIVAGELNLRRTQTGCVRFSYVGPGSQAPGGYRRQPDSAVAEAVAAARSANPSITQAALDELAARAALEAQPEFLNAPVPGHPDQARLGPRAGAAVHLGGEMGGEMGAWAVLGSPFRRANLRERLQEFLPVALAAAIFEGDTIR